MNNFSNYTIEQLAERLGQARFMAYMAHYCGDDTLFERYANEIVMINDALDDMISDSEGGCYA
jgi:hypothetical protein